MRAIALVTSLSLLGCFPHDPHARMIAQISEGGAAALGVTILALTHTNADCEANNMNIAMPDMSCQNKSNALSDIGLALMIGGLVGFIATVSSAEEDPPPPPTNVLTKPKEPLPPVKSPIPLTR